VANGVDAVIASEIYDDIIAFAEYAFKKTHAVAYAVISFQTAFLKRHYPREYMAALLTSVLDHSAKVAEYTAECRDLGIALLPPDVNASDADFAVSEEGIRFGLVAVKNIGWGLIRKLVTERTENGQFESFTDFVERLYGHDLNRRALENLIKCGAFDSMGAKRAQLLHVCEAVLDSVAERKRKNLEGQFDLFGGDTATDGAREQIPLPDIPEYAASDLMRMEKETTGLYLSGHPMDEYRALAKSQGAVRIGDILTDAAGEGGEKRFRDEQYITIAGVVSAYKTKTTRNNTLMAYITLGDDSGDIELLVFARALDRDGAYIAENNPVIVRGKISLRDDKDPQILADSIRPISDLEGGTLPGIETSPQPTAKQKKLYVRLQNADDPAYAKIKLILNMFPGEEQMVVYLKDEDKRLSTRCILHPALVAELGEMLGAENVVIK